MAILRYIGEYQEQKEYDIEDGRAKELLKLPQWERVEVSQNDRTKETKKVESINIILSKDDIDIFDVS